MKRKHSVVLSSSRRLLANCRFDFIVEFLAMRLLTSCLEKSRRDEVPSVFLSPAEKNGFPFVL